MALIDPVIRLARLQAKLGLKGALLVTRAGVAALEAAEAMLDERRTGSSTAASPAAERGADAPSAEEAAAVSPMPDLAPEAVEDEPRAAPRRPRRAPRVPPPPPEAKADDDSPELVAEFAEAGAEEGVGAEVGVREPWDGYDRTRGAEVCARLRGESAETAAAVELYERTHKRRRSVIDAAERRLRDTRNPASGRS
jgi:hypothetical protein